MKINEAFGKALKKVRIARNLTQEDFSQISSRTYVGTLERGLYGPTIGKVDELAGRLEIHPLSLLALSYIELGTFNQTNLLEIIEKELNDILEVEKL